MQQFEKKYLNTSTGERHTFRYNWRLSSYLKDSQMFVVELSLMQTVYTPVTEDHLYSIKNYPELKVLLNKLDMENMVIEDNSHFVYFRFNKNNKETDIIDTVYKVNKLIESAGIIPHKKVTILGNVPDLDYAAKYLEHTTSAEYISLRDIALAMCNGDRIKMLASFAELQVMSEQKFDPDKNTNLNFVLKRSESRVHDICSNLERLTKLVEKATTTGKFHFESTDTYSSEDSKDYSDFQSHWI